jgi:ABC transport system ATP-binding/permease protein
MAPPLLHLKDIRLRIGATELYDGAEMMVSPGDRIGLVGRNGSGKSTLLKIAAGLIEPDGGERFVQPGITTRYLPQEPDLSAYATILDYVVAGLGPGDDPYRGRYLLEQLGLTGDEPTGQLSGGEARRAALARVLAPEPDILMLDEPTNHLDLPAIEWLESELKGSRSALVLISHDRRFLENLTRATVWIDRGNARRMERGFAAFEAWRDQILEQEELERHKLDRQIAREEDWVRYGVSARRKRNVRRMADLGALRQARKTGKRAAGDVRLTAAEADASSRLVFEAKGLVKAFDGRAVVDGFSTRILRGDRVAFVGPNGAGKTTLLKLLIGEIEADQGFRRQGHNLEIVGLDQKRTTLDETATLAEVMTDGRGETVIVGGEARHVVSYMRDFLFKPEQARQPVSVLSGGERARLLLAKALAKPSNVLVLDEPTNDLDLETLDLLQEMLSDYPGTLLLVSHDRDFLDRLATSVIMSEGEGRWVEYAGGYSDMLAQRGAGVAARVVDKPARDTAKAKPTEAAAPKTAKARLTMAEMHALKTLPGEIEALTKEIAKLTAKLSDADYYARDPKGAQATGQALEAAQGRLSAAEERWLELEMKREALGG